jgi:hypothetical protein
MAVLCTIGEPARGKEKLAGVRIRDTMVPAPFLVEMVLPGIAFFPIS